MEHLELNDIMKQEDFDNTKGVIRIQKPKNDKQHNGQKKNDKQRSTKHTHKTKDQVMKYCSRNHSEKDKITYQNIKKMTDRTCLPFRSSSRFLVRFVLLDL
jgi:ABC-type nickel/cobalt efflux system permease component RcnA